MTEINLKDLKERYMMLQAWYLLHEDITDQKIAKVLKTIGDLEMQLRNRGVTEESLTEMHQRTEKFINSDLSQLSPENQVRLVQLIIGVKK